MSCLPATSPQAVRVLPYLTRPVFLSQKRMEISACEIEEGAVGGEEMFMTDEQSAELSKPCVGSFDDPSALVTSQFPTVLIASHLIVLAVGRDQLDATALPSLSQRVGVVAAIRDHPFRLPSRPAFWSGDADFGERGVRKRSHVSRFKGAYEFLTGSTSESTLWTCTRQKIGIRPITMSEWLSNSSESLNTRNLFLKLEAVSVLFRVAKFLTLYTGAHLL